MDDNCEERRGRGRPRKENGRRHVHSIRFTEEEERNIAKLSEKSGMNSAEFIRLCVQVYTNIIGEN